ncbi:hypothetical protein TNCV_2922941 [Trichonephila clavipes]|nr:hypothetical protein TNCV_2922941 [Trichonephila clavipes]
MIREVLRHRPSEPQPRALTTMGASSRFQLCLNKIMIRITSTVQDFFQLYSPKNWGYRTICQLDTCDDRRLCTGLGLPPYSIITHVV